MSVDFTPVQPPRSTFIFPHATVVGDVTLGENCSVWFGAVLRADENPIVIGDDTNIQDNAVIHTNLTTPTLVGKGVTIGHGAILHSCTVGDNSLIGMGAIILDGAVIGKNCIIGAGALVTGRTVIPDNSLVVGSPAKVKRQVTHEEVESNRRNALAYKLRKERYR